MMKRTMRIGKLAVLVLTGLVFQSFTPQRETQNQTLEKVPSQTDLHMNKDSIVYKTDNLVLVKLSEHVYQHVSFLQTQDFGKVACNGMVVVNDREATVFDTPTDNTGSEELIQVITQKLASKITAVVATHFHDDCVGGIQKFTELSIPFFASNKTIAFLKQKENKYVGQIQGFDKKLALPVGNKKVYVQYVGEGHTKDNVIGYFPADQAVFGGCLIKETGASKGYLGDANVSAWPETVRKLKKKYPQTKLVIPGHGKPGGTDLLDYTIQLFQK